MDPSTNAGLAGLSGSSLLMMTGMVNDCPSVRFGSMPKAGGAIVELGTGVTCPSDATVAGPFLAVSQYAGYGVVLVPIAGGDPMHLLDGRQISSVALEPDGSAVYYGTFDGEVGVVAVCVAPEKSLLDP